jgi:hypothetical protein
MHEESKGVKNSDDHFRVLYPLVTDMSGISVVNHHPCRERQPTDDKRKKRSGLTWLSVSRLRNRMQMRNDIKIAFKETETIRDGDSFWTSVHTIKTQ